MKAGRQLFWTWRFDRIAQSASVSHTEQSIRRRPPKNTCRHESRYESTGLACEIAAHPPIEVAGEAQVGFSAPLMGLNPIPCQRSCIVFAARAFRIQHSQSNCQTCTTSNCASVLLIDRAKEQLTLKETSTSAPDAFFWWHPPQKGRHNHVKTPSTGVPLISVYFSTSCLVKIYSRCCHIRTSVRQQAGCLSLSNHGGIHAQ